MTTYDVTVTREDNLWVADVHGLPKGVVSANDWEHFAELHDELPDLYGALLQADPATLTFRYRYEVNGEDVTAQLRSYLDAEGDFRAVQQNQERARKEALAALTGAGLSQRAMADVVGISHQRVNQLIHQIAS